MTKRRINKQQAARIQKIQENYRQKTEQVLEQTEEGLVLTRFRRHAEIETPLKQHITCSIRPNIDSLVAGDRVVWQAQGEKQGVVVSRYPRQSVLGRPDKRGEIKPIAANITQVIVVVAPKPELTWPLLDSYLVMAEHLTLPICIVLNKIDLACEPLIQELYDCYQPLGYSILKTSKHHSETYTQLKQALNNQTSIFVGQSGVGKSSLIASLLPHEIIEVAEISEIAELGRHTTSNSRLYHLPSGGALIDSPGVREFGLWNMTASEITRGYREFKPLVVQCKFRNCNHQNTPGCAIIAALHHGSLAQKRYDNFIKLIDNTLER